MKNFDAGRAAFVMIDPQNWTLGMPIAPHSKDTMLANAMSLVKAIKSVGGILILTRAAFSEGYTDMLKQQVDIPLNVPEGGIPPEAVALNPQMEAAVPESIITKRQWSAFYGTELDLQLRRRGITTIVLGGVMTNFGVESTARDAWQSNYTVVVAEDACSSLTKEMHLFAIERILPRVARVRSSASIVEACLSKTDL